MPMQMIDIETPREAMSKRDRQRHIFGGFVGGVSEHEALVASACTVIVLNFSTPARFECGIDTGADL